MTDSAMVEQMLKDKEIELICELSTMSVVDDEQLDTSENPDDSGAAEHHSTEPDFTENSKTCIHYLSHKYVIDCHTMQGSG